MYLNKWINCWMVHEFTTGDNYYGLKGNLQSLKWCKNETKGLFLPILLK